MDVILDLGIISGYQKRFLQKYIVKTVFRQRKNYDEYYVDIDKANLTLSVSDLMSLSKCFNIDISCDCISIKDKP